jgi:adenylate cyclase
MREAMSKAAPVLHWLIKEGRFTVHNMRDTGDKLCEQIVAAGIPIVRGFCGVRTLHPLVAATAYIWRRGEGTGRIIATWEQTEDPEFNDNPLAQAMAQADEGDQITRRRLDVPEDELEFEIFRQFKREGMTDYVAMPLIFSDGRHNPTSFQTDAPGGFSDSDVAALQDVINMLAPIVETESAYRTARQVVRTYVGRRTGARVLSGAITRGSGETIDAIIWYCDLRGFTSLTDSLPGDQLMDLLNDYFEIMAGAVTEVGGEVLKFIGDAMLAIYELNDEEGDDAAACSAKTLAAARTARERVDARNAERQAAGLPLIECGLALHLGSVHYGNIGAPDRLDFTVIGPAVNHAARLETLGAELGEPIIVSASVAAAAPVELRPLGEHRLRGVEVAQKVFAPTD